jgi:multiple sugar transport system substrate-binding protein/raffinose/stachyose/melibiose transport system substrate-binding protein
MGLYTEATLMEVMHKQQASDLTELWAQSGLIENYPASLQVLSVYEGKQFYLPILYQWEAIYYNKALFAQYNLQPPQTWEEFLQVCDTLLANGVPPLVISRNDAYSGLVWFDYLNLRLNGPDFQRAVLAGQVPFDDERIRTVLEYWRRLLDRGYFLKDPSFSDGYGPVTAIIRGDKGQINQQKAAMVLTESGWVGALPAPFRAELDFFRFPTIDPAIADGEAVFTFGYVVPTKAAHRLEALAFLRFLSTPEAQAIVARHTAVANGTFASMRSDLAPDLLTPETRKALALILAANDAVPPFYASMPATVWPALDSAFGRLIGERRDIDGAIHDLEKARQQAVAQGWWPKLLPDR